MSQLSLNSVETFRIDNVVYREPQNTQQAELQRLKEELEKASVREIHEQVDDPHSGDQCKQQAVRVTVTEETPETLDWSAREENPYNWSATRKYSILVLNSLSNAIARYKTKLNFPLRSVCVSAFEPALPQVLKDLHSSEEFLGSFLVSAYLIGYIFGPTIVAPVSEVYGRTAVLWPAYILFTISLAICGACTSLPLFIIIRAIMGLAGNALVIIGPVMVADMMPPEQRGLALSILTSGSTLGPTLGPTIGGVIIQRLGWRWTFWIALILFAIQIVLAVFIVRETYEPVLRTVFDRPGAKKMLSINLVPAASKKDGFATVVKKAFVRPFKLFFMTFVVPLIALTSTISYMFLGALWATLGTVFEDQYGFAPIYSGLTYIGMAVGFAFSLVTVGTLADRYLKLMTQRRGKRKPEYRLPLATIGMVILIPAVFTYAWTLQFRIFWLVPIIASAIATTGALYVFMASQMYLIDTYIVFAASATGAIGIFRSICSAFFPLSLLPLYRSCGYGWTNSIIAFIALAFLPITIYLQLRGEKLRKLSRFTPDL